MNQLTFNPSPNPNPGCAERITLAERELAAFVSAVTRLFGSEQAELSADDWLQELEASNDLPASAREWRLITNRVTKQLAIQLNAASPSTGSQLLRRKRICVFSSPAPQAL